jgi:hypothetical protein
MNDELLLARAAEAAQAKPYIETVINEAKNLIFDRIMGLAPDQTIYFTVYKSQMVCLDDILSVLEADITNGQNALARLQGETEQKGGIL